MSDQQVPYDSKAAWRTVAGGFLGMFVVFGIMYSFGTFFVAIAAEFDAGSARTALMFSLVTFATYILGAATGRAVDRVGPRALLLLGAVALGGGLVATSQAADLGLIYLTYGAGLGLAVACGYVPLLTTVSGWFQRQRAMALGLAVSGIGLGTLVVAPVAGVLIDRYGWRTAMLLLGVVGAGLLLVSATLVSPPPPSAEVAPGPLRSRLRSPAFRWLYVSNMLFTSSVFFTLAFLAPYASAGGASTAAAGTLVGVIGISSVVGRLALGGTAVRFGALRVFEACFLLVSLSMLVWIFAGSYAWLVGFAVLFGIGYGGFVALSPAVLAEKFGLEGLGGIMGLLYTAAGISGLLAPPLAGLLIDRTDSYTVAIVAVMVAGIAGLALLLPLPRLPTMPREEAGG